MEFSRHLMITKKLFRLWGSIAFLIVALNVAPCRSDPGDLDLTFGNWGTVITDFGAVSSDESIDAVLQEDGKLLVALEWDAIFMGTNPTVIRFNRDGSVDETFGDGGKFAVRFFDPDGFYRRGHMGAISLLPDGKILIGASYQSRNSSYFTLTRLHSNGSVDTAFGNNGLVQNDFGYTSRTIVLNDIVVQADNQIVAAGSIEGKFAVARYHPDGRLDESFGNQGLVTLDFGPEYYSETVEIVILQPDGKIIAAGGSGGSRNRGLIARLNSDGSLDENFGTGGKVTEPYFGYITTGALQADGKIILNLMRFNSDGTHDPSFNLEGGAGTAPYDLTIDNDGKIITAGYADLLYLSLSRYHSDGKIDRNFGEDGLVRIPFENQDGYGRAEKVLLRNDGTIIAVGDVWINWLSDPDRPEHNVGDGTIYGGDDTAKYLAIVQCDRYGGLDPKFDDDGKLTINVGAPSDDWANDVIATQPDGKIIVGGEVIGPYAHNFGLIRYNPDGTLDDTFGDGGKVITDFRYYREDLDLNRFRSYEWIDALAIHEDGKIVAAGTSWPAISNVDAPGVTPTAFVVARYNTDGSLDATFGTDGRVITEIGGDRPYGMVNDVLIQPNEQKIIVAGYAERDPDPRYPTRKFFLVRYNYDGSLDNTFGDHGTVTTDFDPERHEYASSAVIQDDGKLIVGGYTYSLYNPQLSYFALIRYNEDGSIDESFGEGGKAKTKFSDLLADATYPINLFYDILRSLILQPDGRIVAAGGSTAAYDYRQFGAVARFMPDGSLDGSFGDNGRVIVQLSQYSEIYDCGLQHDGKIVVAGFGSYFPSEPKFNIPVEDFALARLNPDGSLDISFGDNGIVTTNINTFTLDGEEYDVPTEQATAMSIQADGKIVAAGWTKTYTIIEPSGTGLRFAGHWDIALARYEAFGSIMINGCDTGVTDRLYMGKTVTDWINECAVAAQNHGKYVSCVSHFTNQLKQADLISGIDKGAIQRCAGQANLQ